MGKNYIKHLLALMLLVCSTAAFAQATSTVSASFDGATMLVNITNPDYPFTAIQFDLELPEGIEVDFDGEYYAVDLGSRTNNRKHSYPECAIQPDGSLRVVIISMSNALYNGTEGDVATAALKVNGAADGNYQFTIKNVVLSDPSSSNEKLEPYTGWVAVEGGAVVGAGEEPVVPDYSAEIAALRALVTEAQATHDAAVEGTANGEYPAGAKAALQAVITEVNGKISDTMTLDEINACTAQINAAVTEFEGKVITNAGGDEGDDVAVASTVSASFDGATMLVNITNPDYPFSAIQFDLELPEGIEVDFDGEYYVVDLGSRTNSRKHSYPECAIYSGSFRVVIVSMSNALYNGTEGDVATAALKVNGAADGNYQFTIKNVVLSAPGSKEKLEPYTGWVAVEGGVVVGAGEEPVAPDYSAEIAALRALVAEAQATHDAAVEGTANGEYPAGAKAALQAVITEVNGKISDTMTLDEINACTAQINAAVTEFEGKVITNAGGDDDPVVDDVNNTISIVNTVARAGQQIPLSIHVDNIVNVAGLEFSLYLPEGFTLSVNDRGRYIYNLSDRCSEGAWSLASNQVGDHYNISMLDTDFVGLEGNSGEVLSLFVDVAENVADGYHPITIKGIEVSDDNGDKYNTSIKTSEVYVYSYILGDVNDDGEYSTNDAVNIVKYAINEELASDHPVADVNLDDNISTNDAVNVVKWAIEERVPTMVFPEHSNNAPAYVAAKPFSLIDENYLDIETIVGQPGDEIEVPILLYYTFEDGITSAQFDIVLPDGVTAKTDNRGRPVIKDGELIDGHTLTRSYKDNKLKVSSMSMDGYTYWGESGDVLYTVTLIIDEGIEFGEYLLELQGVELSLNTVDENGLVPAIKPIDRQIKIIVSDPTGIEDVIAEGAECNASIYDLTGRAVKEVTTPGIYIVGGKTIFVK